jgi:hypothetical protein
MQNNIAEDLRRQLLLDRITGQLTLLKPSNTQLVLKSKKKIPVSALLYGHHQVLLTQGLRIQRLKILIFVQCSLMLVLYSQGKSQPYKNIQKQIQE